MPVEQPHIIFNQRNQSGNMSRRLQLACYTAVDVYVYVTALNGAPSAASLDFKLQRKFPNSGSDWIDISGKAITTVTEATSLNNTQVISLAAADLNLAEMRWSITVSFTGGTNPSWTMNVAYVART